MCQDIDVELPVHWNRISRILYQVRRRMWSSLQLSTLLLLVTLVHVLFTLTDARAHNFKWMNNILESGNADLEIFQLDLLNRKCEKLLTRALAAWEEMSISTCTTNNSQAHST